jgi:hypothetical protein
VQSFTPSRIGVISSVVVKPCASTNDPSASAVAIKTATAIAIASLVRDVPTVPIVITLMANWPRCSFAVRPEFDVCGKADLAIVRSPQAAETS